MFDGAALDGGLDLKGSGAILKNGTTLGAQSIRMSTGNLTFADANMDFDGTLAAYGDYGDSNRVNIGSLTLGSHAVVSSDPAPAYGYSALLFTASGDVTNRGTILSNPTGIITFDALAGTFRNEGAIDPVGPWSYGSPSLGVRADRFLNAGTIDLTNGSYGSFVGSETFDDYGSQTIGTMTLDRGAFAAPAETIGHLIVNGGGSQYENRLNGAAVMGGLSVASGANIGFFTDNDPKGHVRLDGDASIDGGVYSSILDVFGGTVVGNGHVQSLSLHGGTLAHGHSTGSMSVDAFTMDAASRFELEIGGDAASNLFDRLTTDTSALDGTLDLSVVNGYAPQAGTWRFLTASSGLTGTFSTLHLGQGWSYGQDATGAFVSFAPVPEPASLAALGLGLTALARRRRK